MKVKIFIVGLICLIFGVSTVNAQAYREVDRFTGKTTIYSTKRRIGITRASVLYFCINEEWVGRILSDPMLPMITGCFQEWGQSRWMYLKFHDLTFLVDGERIVIGKTDYDGNVGAFGGPKLRETVIFWISWSDFCKLLDADKVEYKLGAYERNLKKKELKEMRSFRDEVLK